MRGHPPARAVDKGYAGAGGCVLCAAAWSRLPAAGQACVVGAVAVGVVGDGGGGRDRAGQALLEEDAHTPPSSATPTPWYHTQLACTQLKAWTCRQLYRRKRPPPTHRPTHALRPAQAGDRVREAQEEAVKVAFEGAVSAAARPPACPPSTAPCDPVLGTCLLTWKLICRLDRALHGAFRATSICSKNTHIHMDKCMYVSMAI